MKKADADLFVSIHMNSFQSSKAKGLHVFYAQNHPEAREVAENIQNRIKNRKRDKYYTYSTQVKR